MVIRRGFTPSDVFSSADLLKELDDLGSYTPDEVIAGPFNYAARRPHWRACAIRERESDNVLVTVLAKNDNYLSNILRSAQIEREDF